MIRRLLCGLATAAMLASGIPVAAAQPAPRKVRSGIGTANPSALVALEIAFARRAREKGQWKAFRQYADDTAIMFVPYEVKAREWLAKQAEPAEAMTWQPYQVWMSCDGTLGVSKGAWQKADGSTGWFTTIWKRQKDGSYRWVLDHGDVSGFAMAKPEMLSARVAQCSPRPNAPPSVTPPEGARTFSGGNSLDGTLRWNVAVSGQGDARELGVQLWNGTAFETIVEDNVVPGS